MPFEEILVLDPAPRDAHIVARHERGRPSQYYDALYNGAEVPLAEPGLGDEGSSEANIKLNVRDSGAGSATSSGPVTEVSVAVHAMLAQEVPGDIAIRNMRAQIQSRMAQLADHPFTARDRRVGKPQHDLTLSELEVRCLLNFQFFHLKLEI